MPNTITSLIPDFFAALDVVSRELTGFIPSVARDSTADRVAVGQTLRTDITPANTAGDNITPAMAIPSAAYQTIGNASLTISKSRFFPFSWSGEQSKAVDMGPGFLTVKQNQIAQAIRSAVNEIETDIAAAAYKGSSRAWGASGITPFSQAGDYSDAAQTRKILDDNGAPQSDRALVLSTAAGANIRAKQAQAHIAGDTSLQRQGILFDINGLALRESAQAPSVTKGTGAGYLVNLLAGYSIGATSIALDTGAGTMLQGDVIKFDNDDNLYVVATALGAGTVVLAAPGLRKALADNTGVTIQDSYTASIGFSRNAILLATRLPDLPGEGDLATDRMAITDPRSGLSFELAVYPGYRMVTYHVSVSWGVSVIKPEHVATLLG